MVGIIGKKIGMTSVYNEAGHMVPCTVVEATPCVVTQIKEMAKEGYTAIQLAGGEKKKKNTTKPLLGHFKKAQVAPHRHLVEFRSFAKAYRGEQPLALGTVLSVADLFKEGDVVGVVGRSKGKGFQGVVKRHGFSGVGGRTHGQHNRERAPGSIGGASFPSRVFKGMRMAGRMGGERKKVLLEVLKVLPEKNLLLLAGSVPGANQGRLILTNTSSLV